MSMVCYDHDCMDHEYNDPACNHMVCTLMTASKYPEEMHEIMDDQIEVDTPRWVETHDGRKYLLIPPRPDYRWSINQGRIRHEPEDPLFPLPAPPDVAVMVPSDIEKDVRMYAERRNAEKRLGRTP